MMRPDHTPALRSVAALLCGLFLCLALGCEESKGGGDEDGAAGGDGSDTLPDELADLLGDGGLPDGLLPGQPPPIPQEVLEGADDDASLQERYATRCEPGAMTLSGELDGAPFMGSFRSGTGGVNPFGQLRSFGERGEISVTSEGAVPLFTETPVSSSRIILPRDSELPWSVVCGGDGSTFERTPLEEVLEMRQASLHACPGEPVEGQLDACIVFGLDETLCEGGEGLFGTLDGAVYEGGAPSSTGGSGNTYRAELGPLELTVAYGEGEGTVAIEQGLMVSTGGRLAPGVYCVGEGSTWTREEMDFDDRITIELRNISRLPGCDGASGGGNLTACFRR